ncbi:hypothetical protein QO004_002515 [Rhizobium mesoamericanum]|nr:hypothetical protein [Rhizobium mesoamericanum]
MNWNAIDPPGSQLLAAIGNLISGFISNRTALECRLPNEWILIEC